MRYPLTLKEASQDGQSNLFSTVPFLVVVIFLTSILFVLVVVVMTIGSSTFENTGCFFLVYFLLVVGDTGESPFDVTEELLDGISCGT